MVSDLSSGQIEVGFSDVTGQLYYGGKDGNMVYTVRFLVWRDSENLS